MADRADSVRADLQQTRSRLAATHAEYACLLAACRASVAAAAAGHPDPLGYVRGVLAERGQLPARGSVPLVVLADARTALCLTGWPVPGDPERGQARFSQAGTGGTR
jgi:hypothetical protein